MLAPEYDGFNDVISSMGLVNPSDGDVVDIWQIDGTIKNNPDRSSHCQSQDSAQPRSAVILTGFTVSFSSDPEDSRKVSNQVS
jgi:hypothetical protein